MQSRALIDASALSSIFYRLPYNEGKIVGEILQLIRVAETKKKEWFFFLLLLLHSSYEVKKVLVTHRKYHKLSPLTASYVESCRCRKIVEEFSVV